MSKKKAPSRTEPSLEQWKSLYETAQNLKKLAPWQALSDTDILMLQLPGQSEPVYCSIMGQGGMSYGISVYPGKEAFVRLMRIIDLDAHNPGLLMLEQKCLACNFGDREELEQEDRAVLKELGLRFRGRNQWIYFRSLVPGQFPWFLDAGQAELMLSVLQNLTALCTAFMAGELKADFYAGETLCRRYDPETDTWINEVVPLPMPTMERSLNLQDDLLLARLKRSKKTKVRVEIDSFYLPVPIQEDKHSPPAAAYMALLVDKNSGRVLGNDFADAESPDYVVAPSMLANYIMAHGRPAAVYVRSGWVGSLLRNFCKAIGVRLVEDEGVPVLDSVLDIMMGDLLAEAMGDDDFE